MSGQHTSFQIDNVNYQLSSDCIQALWPRLVDKVARHLERIGKFAAADMYGHSATARGYTTINKQLIKYDLTVNPKGLQIATK